MNAQTSLAHCSWRVVQVLCHFLCTEGISFLEGVVQTTTMKVSLIFYTQNSLISHTFVDIDECGERNGLCSDVCINDDYSYQCGCAPGRTLSDDGLNCGGKPAAESSTRNALVFVSFTLLTQVFSPCITSSFTFSVLPKWTAILVW